MLDISERKRDCLHTKDWTGRLERLTYAVCITDYGSQSWFCLITQKTRRLITGSRAKWPQKIDMLCIVPNSTIISYK